jgi:hypothetical protein
MDAALAAAIFGPVVGVAGVVFGWLQSRGERDNARQLVEHQHEHSRHSALSERLFEARSEAYEALLRQLHRVMMIIERTEPMIGPTSPAPDRPSDEEWTEMYVSIAMFGSPELNEAFRDFGAKWAAFQVHASQWARVRQGQPGATNAGMDMHDARQEAAGTLREMERMIREELAAL